MSKAGWIHGSTIDPETRQVRYLSSSSLQLADMSTEKGCLRKFWYAYVRGLKEPQTWQQAAGEKDHECVERYLATGVRNFSPRVAKGIHMLPPPGPHLQIEHDMVPSQWTACKTKHKHTYDCPPCTHEEHDDKCRQVSGLHLAPLRAADIPMVGRIDLMHDLCQNYGAEGVEDAQDPEGTVEVFDHKFTKDLRYALRGQDMVRNIQMVAYGEYVFRTVPGVTHVRLSHGYYPTNGNAVKRTIRTTRETLSRYWTEHVEPLARSIADAAKEENPDNVKANTKACQAFGRVCMHATYCNAGAQLGLQSQVGGTAAAALLQIIKKPKDPNPMPLIPGKGLLAHITKPADNAAREAELAKLKAEEAAAKKAALPPGLAETIAKIETIAARNSLGWPNLKGKAAEAFITMTGQKREALGALENVEITDVDQYDALLAELTEAFGDPGAVVSAEPTEEVPPAGILPDDAPVITASPPKAEEKPNPLADVQAEADKPKPPRKPRTTKPKAVDTTATETPDPKQSSVVTVTERMADEAQGVKTAPADTRINLIVDVLVEGHHEFQDFGAMVDALSAAMAQRFNLDDIRTGGSDSPLGYGKWKGVLAAAIRETEIPPGTYYINARGSEIYEEAVNALRQVVKRSGGYYLEGGRR